MKKNSFTYTLTLTSSQLRAVCGAVELLMRLKINQPEEIPRGALNWGDGLSVDEWCRRRDKEEPLLRQAFKELFPTWEDVKKDEQWYRLYNLYQVTRYALHEAENPEGKGVDSYPPWNSGGVDEPMPKCTFIADSENPLARVKISKPTFKEDSRE